MEQQDNLAAIYARVSDAQKQGENFSTATQLDKMRNYCISESWEIVAELQEQGSAYLDGLNRSELKRALDLAREGRIKALIFFSPDRFTRDMADGVILRRELKRYGVRLICYWPTPHEITSDMEIMHILTDWQSQQFIEKMREASMRGVAGKIEAGLFPQGVPPYGYRLMGKKRSTYLEVVEEEEVIIVRIFHWYVYEDIGCHEIAKRLNEARVPLRRKADNVWTGRNVRHLLAREAYTGIWYAYTKRNIGKGKQVRRPREDWKPIEVPVIISRGLWEQARRKLASRHVGRKKNDYLMSSRIDCTCGNAVKGQRSQHPAAGGGIRVYNYYRCGSEATQAGPCGMPKFIAPQVDAVVWKFAFELIHNPEKLLRGYRELQEETQEENAALTRQIESIQAQIADQEALLASLIQQRSQARSVSLQAMLDQNAETTGATIDDLLARLNALQGQQRAEPFTDEHIQAAVHEINALRDMYEALHAINEEADYPARRALIDILNLTATIRIDRDGVRWVDIHWLRRVYPRVVAPENNPPTPLLFFGTTMILTFSLRLLG